MSIFDQTLFWQSTFGLFLRRPDLIRKKCWFEKSILIQKSVLIQFWIEKLFWRDRAGRPEAGRRGPDPTPFLEPNPYKTCRFLRILAKKRSQKRPGRGVDPSRDRAPRLIRKEVFDLKKYFDSKKYFDCKILFDWNTFSMADPRFDWWKEFLIQTLL